MTPMETMTWNGGTMTQTSSNSYRVSTNNPQAAIAYTPLASEYTFEGLLNKPPVGSIWNSTGMYMFSEAEGSPDTWADPQVHLGNAIVKTDIYENMNRHSYVSAIVNGIFTNLWVDSPPLPGD